MIDQAQFSPRGRNPDVLNCIANLSNDEVFTPAEFANRILDTLAEAWAVSTSGANIWEDKTVTFLDPCTKSGVFLREITNRLNTLQDVITKIEPDLFETVTGLTVKDFHLLVRLRVFNTEQMNAAVFAFRRTKKPPCAIPASRATTGSRISGFTIQWLLERRGF